jgi:hypothetical protein
MAKNRRSPRPRSRVHFLPRICESERTSDPGPNHNTLGAGCPGESSSGRRQNKSGDDSFHRSSSWAGSRQSRGSRHYDNVAGGCHPCHRSIPGRGTVRESQTGPGPARCWQRPTRRPIREVNKLFSYLLLRRFNPKNISATRPFGPVARFRHG